MSKKRVLYIMSTRVLRPTSFVSTPSNRFKPLQTLKNPLFSTCQEQCHPQSSRAKLTTAFVVPPSGATTKALPPPPTVPTSRRSSERCRRFLASRPRGSAFPRRPGIYQTSSKSQIMVCDLPVCATLCIHTLFHLYNIPLTTLQRRRGRVPEPCPGLLVS